MIILHRFWCDARIILRSGYIRIRLHLSVGPIFCPALDTYIAQEETPQLTAIPAHTET